MRKSRTLAVLLAAFAVLPAAAQMIEMPAGKWWKRPPVVESLKITPEQQERLDEVFSKNRRAFVDLKADVDRRTIDLEDLLAARDLDPRKARAASDALEQARSRLGRARTMMVVEMRGILTEEQWSRIVDRREQWRSEREKEMRRRSGDRRGPLRPGRNRAVAPGRGTPAPAPEPPDEPES
jgi:Spy/CpxP family protein refolding chaperone